MRISLRLLSGYAAVAFAFGLPGFTVPSLSARPDAAQGTSSRSAAPSPLRVVPVKNSGELRAALNGVQPGTRISLAPGEYPGGYWCKNAFGEPGRPIIISAADPNQPPVIKGGSGAFQFAGARYLEIRDLRIENMSGNALAIDDAGVRESPAHHIVVKGVRFSDLGPTGNHHAIKLAGVDDFQIRNCRFDRWSGGAGIAIDAVGCHKGIIEGNDFRGRTEMENRSFGALQFKGGSRDIVVRKNRFEHPGLRAVNIGGSTGIPYFRPTLENWPNRENRCEAKGVRIEGNTFIGGDAPVAFVNTDGAVVRFNTIYQPERWALRISQETRLPGFGPSRNGVFTDNLIVFQSKKWAEGGVNIGSGTAPATFQFARNFWYCVDAPAKSRPNLPALEKDGVYGVNPRFESVPGADFRLLPDSPARRYGAEAFEQ